MEFTGRGLVQPWGCGRRRPPLRHGRQVGTLEQGHSPGSQGPGAGRRNLSCVEGTDDVRGWDWDLDFPQPCLTRREEPPFQMLWLTPRGTKMQVNL